MKRFTILRTELLQVVLLWLCSLSASAQVPSAMDYQLMATNPKTGQVLANKELLVKVELRLNSEDGETVWSKEETLTSSKSGICTMSLDFTDIDWTLGSYYVKAFINGEPIGASQIKSVPFALMADGVNGVITKHKLVGTWVAVNEYEDHGAIERDTFTFVFNQDGTFSYNCDIYDDSEIVTGTWKLDNLGNIVCGNLNSKESSKTAFATVYDKENSELIILGHDHQFYNWQMPFYKKK